MDQTKTTAKIIFLLKRNYLDVITESALFRSLNYCVSNEEKRSSRKILGNEVKVTVMLSGRDDAAEAIPDVSATAGNISASLFQKEAIREIVLHKIIK